MKNRLDSIDGVYLIDQVIFEDSRGYFLESYNNDGLKEAGINDNFVQDNISFSRSKFTLRGLHFQCPPQAQGKLVRCLEGKIYDVVVDIRLNSPTYMKWASFLLDSDSQKQLYVPKGFAHGFLTLEDNTKVLYKCSSTYAPKFEYSINWNDKDLSIVWPINNEEPILSRKDSVSPMLSEIISPFIFGENS